MSYTAEPTSPEVVKPRDYLFGSRMLDFWLLGGLSIAVWAPFYFFGNDIQALKEVGMTLPAASLVLAFFINDPHFMASYKLAYTQGRRFIFDNWFQLVFVPVFLVLVLVVSYTNWNTPFPESPVVPAVNNALKLFGIKTEMGAYPSLGYELAGYMVVLMFLTVGWHYAKQTFGCMMVYAKLDGYPLSTGERNVFRYTLLSTWWITWLFSNGSVGSYEFYGLTVLRLGLPDAPFLISFVMHFFLLGSSIYVLIKKYVKDRQKPSINFLTPALALFIWQLPVFANPQFFVLIALFHSLQYFPFVAKVESTRYRGNGINRVWIRMSGFYALMISLGYLSFYFVPTYLDLRNDTEFEMSLAFFAAAFLLFINIHHYFIDNVLWRFKNKDVRSLLFGQ